MRKITTVEGIEISFNDLKEAKQKIIYKKNKEKYKQDASKSIYSSIRRMVARDATESALLNEMLRNEISNDKDCDVEKAIFTNEFFEAEEETIMQLAISDWWGHRQKAAKLSKDIKFLNEMIRSELNNEDSTYVREAIYANKIFEAEEEIIKQLAASAYSSHREEATKLSKDTKFLNEMLRKELSGELHGFYDVVEAIFNNTFFEPEEETIKQLAESVCMDYRQKAAKLSKDTKLLNELLRNELKNRKHFPVANEILENEIFEAEEETIKQLGTSAYWYLRQKAAELSKNTELLNEMLRKELSGERDDNVERAICNNTFFKPEEEIIEQLAASKYSSIRQKAAELTKNSNVLLKMFVRELKSDYADLRVIETIVKNETFIPEKTALLECIRKTY